MTRVFILGAAGYIGGAVLVALKKAHSSLHFTALVRSPADARALEAIGTSVIIGSFTDYDKVTALVAEHDIVINSAHCDDVALGEAILAGLKRKKEAGHGIGAFIHTSGAAIFMDDVKDGTCPSNRKIWTDSEEDIRALKPEMMHAPVDIPILKAGEEGVANTYIICPSAVYGPSSGPCHKPSVFYKFVVASIIAAGHATIAGEGKNVVGTIHLDDLVAMYLIIFDAALKAGLKLLTSSPYARYYIMSTRDVPVSESRAWLARALHKLGKIGTSELNRIKYEDAGPYAHFLTANMAPKGTRAAKEFGWAPKAPDMNAEVVEQDVKETLAHSAE